MISSFRKISAAFFFAVTLGAPSARASTWLNATFAPGPWLERFNSAQPAPWVDGEERTEIVTDAERGRPVLEVNYPSHAFGLDQTGAAWRTYLARHLDRATLSFDVKFGGGFDFVKGGKLPGLVGGARKDIPDSTASDGYHPDGTDAWSARVHWLQDGRIIQYVYHQYMPGPYGEEFAWQLDGAPARFAAGRWYRVRVEVTMNTLGRRDGRIRAWLDERLTLDAANFEFRTVPGLAIDSLVFSTFFGGADDSFATTKDESARFDHFVVED